MPFLILSTEARHGAVILIPGTEAVLSGTGVFRLGAVGLVSRTEALTYNARTILWGIKHLLSSVWGLVYVRYVGSLVGLTRA